MCLHFVCWCDFWASAAAANAEYCTVDRGEGHNVTQKHIRLCCHRILDARIRSLESNVRRFVCSHFSSLATSFHFALFIMFGAWPRASCQIRVHFIIGSVSVSPLPPFVRLGFVERSASSKIESSSTLPGARSRPHPEPGSARSGCDRKCFVCK